MCADLKGRATFGIPAKGDEIFIFHQLQQFPLQYPDVTAQHQRGPVEAPENKFGFVFPVGTSAGPHISFSVHTHGQHIQIVVAARSGTAEIVQLGFGNLLKGLIVVLNVGRGAEQVSSGRPGPALPDAHSRRCRWNKGSLCRWPAEPCPCGDREFWSPLPAGNSSRI